MGERRMNPLVCYVRARLQRRLFVWFAATILFTVMAVAYVMFHSGDSDEKGFLREVQRVQAFVSGRFALVWDNPAERDVEAQRDEDERHA